MSNAIYMKIDTLDGECSEANHDKWMKIDGFSHNISAHIDRSAVGATGGRTVGNVEHGDFIVTKVLDSATLPIMLQCCQGQHFTEARLHMVTSTTASHTMLEIVLKEVVISSINMSDSSGQAGRPVEQIGLNYKEIEWNYTPIDETGSPLGTITKSWNCASNTGA